MLLIEFRIYLYNLNSLRLVVGLILSCTKTSFIELNSFVFLLEEEAHVDIDKSIFDVLLNPPDLSNWQNSGLEEQALHEILGYLLSWMLMFDHFTDIVSISLGTEVFLTHSPFLLIRHLN